MNNHSSSDNDILAGIHAPEDVKAIPATTIPRLCSAIRQTILSRVLENGGHLASNLGAVELTVALHRVFSAPTDHFIFDVGHQSYTHKLLTGRYAAFETLRKPGGISGFPKRSESVYDAFGTGHASTSLSAGIGFAQADYLSGSDAWTVVIMGDGALSGGMSYEALNNCARKLHLLLIINENEMSITRNVGHMARMLTRIRTSHSYNRTKSILEKVLEHIPLLGKPCIRGLISLKTRIKMLFFSSNYFENMGLYYLGPVDGNNEETVEQLLRVAKSKNRSCVVHVKTVKGKGYEPAERDPSAFHGLSPHQYENTDKGDGLMTFSETFGNTLTSLAAQNERICAITAAMQSGTGLTPFFKAFPERAFDVGIAEEHAVTFAAGLSAAGFLPVVAIYSTFLQRSYDQILHDCALQNLPVIFAIDRAGFNTADGPTHHGIFDVALLSEIPRLELYAPLTTASLSRLLTHLLENRPTVPVAIRYPAGNDHPVLSEMAEPNTGVYQPIEDVYADFSTDGCDLPRTVALSYGKIYANVRLAANRLSSVGTLCLERLSQREALLDLLYSLTRGGVKRFVFFEEGVRCGGLAEHLWAEFAEHLQKECGELPVFRIVAIEDPFASLQPGESYEQLHHLDPDSIYSILRENEISEN